MKVELKELDPKQLQVDEYQRSPSRTIVKGIQERFVPIAFGILAVGRRSDGSYWIVDGNTRREAAIRLGLENVPCNVFDSEGPHHEARLFLMLNDRKPRRKTAH